MSWDTNTSILVRLETFSARTAWTTLAAHFEKPLSRYARRAGLAQSAIPDVVQATLVAFALAYRSGSYDRSRGRLSSWLFGIARREVAGARRRSALEAEHAPVSMRDEGIPEEEDPLEEIREHEW